MIWWIGLAAAQDCMLDVPVDTPFEVQAPDNLETVRLVLLLRLTGSNTEATLKTARVLAGASLTAGFAVHPEAVTETMQPALEALLEMGHQPVVRLRTTEIGVDTVKGPGRLRRLIKPLTSVVGRVRIAEAPTGDETREAMMHRIGLRAVLETNGAPTAIPRTQHRLEGQPAPGVVLPGGPFSGPCGSSAVALPFSTAAADRVTQALYGSRAAGIGMVQGVIVASADTDKVVQRWLNEVLLPGGVQIIGPLAARDIAIKALRSGATKHIDPRRSAGGRLVRVQQVVSVAQAMKGLDTIPRELPNQMAPTEAFLAFLLVVTDQLEGDVVRLPAIQGPATLNHALAEPVSIDRAAAITLATALLSRLPERIPSALPLDGHLLNAPALFSLYASMVRGEDPVARPLAVREPNAPGLGWGGSTTP